MAENTNNDAPPPKRKRNRKKKSKAKKEGGESSNQKKKAQQQETNAQSKMNPHAVLRNDLLSQGFSSDEVDKAMEEMWDLGLQYDEFDAVLKYLKTGGQAAKEQGERQDESQYLRRKLECKNDAEYVISIK